MRSLREVDQQEESWQVQLVHLLEQRSLLLGSYAVRSWRIQGELVMFRLQLLHTLA